MRGITTLGWLGLAAPFLLPMVAAVAGDGTSMSDLSESQDPIEEHVGLHEAMGKANSDHRKEIYGHAKNVGKHVVKSIFTGDLDDAVEHQGKLDMANFKYGVKWRAHQEKVKEHRPTFEDHVEKVHGHKKYANKVLRSKLRERRRQRSAGKPSFLSRILRLKKAKTQRLPEDQQPFLGSKEEQESAGLPTDVHHQASSRPHDTPFKRQETPLADRMDPWRQGL